MSIEKVSVEEARSIINLRCIVKLKKLAQWVVHFDAYDTLAHKRFVEHTDKKYLDDLLSERPKLWDLNQCIYSTDRMMLDTIAEEKAILETWWSLAPGSMVDMPEGPPGWSAIYRACIPLRRHCLDKLKKAAKAQPDFKDRYLALQGPVIVNERIFDDLMKEPAAWWNVIYCFSVAKALDVDLTNEKALYDRWMEQCRETGESTLRAMVEVPDFNDPLYR